MRERVPANIRSLAPVVNGRSTPRQQHHRVFIGGGSLLLVDQHGGGGQRAMHDAQRVPVMQQSCDDGAECADVLVIMHRGEQRPIGGLVRQGCGEKWLLLRIESDAGVAAQATRPNLRKGAEGRSLCK